MISCAKKTQTKMTKMAVLRVLRAHQSLENLVRAFSCHQKATSLLIAGARPVHRQAAMRTLSTLMHREHHHVAAAT